VVSFRSPCRFTYKRSLYWDSMDYGLGSLRLDGAICSAWVSIRSKPSIEIILPGGSGKIWGGAVGSSKVQVLKLKMNRVWMDVG
jgi:hypothetical protein